MNRRSVPEASSQPDRRDTSDPNPALSGEAAWLLMGTVSEPLSSAASDPEATDAPHTVLAQRAYRHARVARECVQL